MYHMHGKSLEIIDNLIFQRLGVHFTEYHSESMFHGKSL